MYKTYKEQETHGKLNGRIIRYLLDSYLIGVIEFRAPHKQYKDEFTIKTIHKKAFSRRFLITKLRIETPKEVYKRAEKWLEKRMVKNEFDKYF